MKSFPDVFCIIDTETTGMRAAFSRIIDIGIIRVEHGKVVKRYETLLNPGISIPSVITGITGLTSEDLITAPTFEDVALEIQEVLRDAVFVAHNVSFDYSFVKQEFKRIGIDYTAPKLCSVNLSRALFPKERSHNLDAIIDRYNIRVSTRHRAMPDAEAVLTFFKHVTKKIDTGLLTRTVNHVLDKTSPRTSTGELPDNAGVYFLYGEDQELLYIGKSKHIRTRVRSHFHKSPLGKEKRIQGETTLIDTVQTSGELSALLLEASLIKRESPLYNRMLRNRKKLVIAKKIINKDEYATVSLEWVEKITPTDEVLGVFRTMTQAKKKIEEIAYQVGLCQKLLGLDTSLGSCFNHQLKKCDGACLGIVSTELYNTRLDQAFAKRKLRIWPYNGIVCITEQENEESGTVFFIDNWILTHSFKYDAGTYEKFGEYIHSFDYDTYKILARYLLDTKNKRTIQVLRESEYKKQIAHMIGHYEATVEI